MIKEFVTYEQALALKELGFDESCFAYYHTTLSSSDVDLVLGKTQNKFYHLVRIPEHFDILAPLKQQVFRWFREKYELGHEICPYYFNANITELQDVDDYPLQHEVYVSSPFTYEEAENACIDKLIEIAKQQDNGK